MISHIKIALLTQKDVGMTAGDLGSNDILRMLLRLINILSNILPLSNILWKTIISISVIKPQSNQQFPGNTGARLK